MKNLVLYSFLMFSFLFYGQTKSGDFKKGYKNYYINDGFSKTDNRSVELLVEFQTGIIDLTINGKLITLMQTGKPLIGKDREGKTKDTTTQKIYQARQSEESMKQQLYSTRLEAIKQAAKIVDQKLTVANLRLQSKAKRGIK